MSQNKSLAEKASAAAKFKEECGQLQVVLAALESAHAERLQVSVQSHCHFQHNTDPYRSDCGGPIAAVGTGRC